MDKSIEEILKGIYDALNKKNPKETLKNWIMITQMLITILVIIFGMFKPFFEMQKEDKRFKQKTEDRLEIIEKVNWETHIEYRWMMTNPSTTRGGASSQLNFNMDSLVKKDKNKL